MPLVSMDLKNNLDLNVYLLSTSAKSHKKNFREQSYSNPKKLKETTKIAYLKIYITCHTISKRKIFKPSPQVD